MITSFIDNLQKAEKLVEVVDLSRCARVRNSVLMKVKEFGTSVRALALASQGVTGDGVRMLLNTFTNLPVEPREVQCLRHVLRRLLENKLMTQLVSLRLARLVDVGDSTIVPAVTQNKTCLS